MTVFLSNYVFPAVYYEYTLLDCVNKFSAVFMAPRDKEDMALDRIFHIQPWYTILQRWIIKHGRHEKTVNMKTKKQKTRSYRSFVFMPQKIYEECVLRFSSNYVVLATY